MAKNPFDLSTKVTKIGGKENSVGTVFYTCACYSSQCYSFQCYSNTCYSVDCYTGQNVCGYSTSC